jgi:hypothetical protein
VFFYILFLDLHRTQDANEMTPMAAGAGFGGGKIGGLGSPTRTRRIPQ